MSNLTRISPNPIVDNHPVVPTFPDIGSLGRSRIGKKLARKAVDRYFIALRRYEDKPAESGPPIRNSEKLLGRREYYTLAQCRQGGRRSGETRRRKANPRWREVVALRRRGLGIRQISRVVGYTAGWISKLIKRLFLGQPKVFPEHYNHHHQPKPVWATHGSRNLTLAVLYRRYALHALEVADRRSLLVPERKRERQFTLAQARIIGRRSVRPSTGFLGALGKGSGVALGLALAACRELDGLPIAEAVRTVNRQFGWRGQS